MIKFKQWRAMSNKKFFCPIPLISLSIEAGLQRRLCCHDTTQETESLKLLDLNNGVATTPLNQKIIKSLKDNVVPTNCTFCFNLEEQGAFSPRQEYLETFDRINENTKTNQIHYLDLTIDNNCNLKCSSCRPAYSSQLINEFQELNIPFNQKLIEKIQNIKHTDYEEFLPHLAHNAMITLTGGEPLISKNTEVLLSFLENNFNVSQMKLRIFTNVTVLPEWFCSIIKSFQRVELILSLDASSKLAEYIRYPSSWIKITKNINKLINLKNHSNGKLSLSIHSVLGAYNINGISSLIKDLLIFQNEFPIIPRLTLLSHPSIISTSVLPHKTIESISSEQISKFEEIRIKLLPNIHSDQNRNNLDDIIAIYKNLSGSDSYLDYLKFIAHTKKIDNRRTIKLRDVVPSLLNLESK